jgi:hypothetical protein
MSNAKIRALAIYQKYDDQYFHTTQIAIDFSAEFNQHYLELFA